MSDDPANFDAFKWECRRKQIESLRVPLEGAGHMANAERAIAALTIDNLMAEVESWQKAMQKADRDMHELRKERDEVVRMINKLTAERDDARALYCWVLEAYKRGDGREEAKKRGWYCFKEKP